MDYDAIVIGTGHNGLTAAAYLQRAGKRTLALERRDIIGGACVTEEVWPGYRISTAAYLCSLLQPEIVSDLRLERYGLEIYRRETAGFAPFPDGRSLFLFPAAAPTRASLHEFCRDTPEDVDAYFAFEDEIERVAAVVEPWLLRPPPDPQTLRADFAAHGIEALYGEYLEGSVRNLLDARFRSPQLKAVLATDGLIGTYGGPSTPGTAYVLLHHYLGRILGQQGAWGYVRGGMGRITQALAAAFTEAGGTIRTHAPVERILVEARPHARPRCTGVQLSTGEILHADLILSNADPYHTFESLLKGFPLSTPEHLNTPTPNTGAPKSLWGHPTPEHPNTQTPPWLSLKTHGGASAKINMAVTELPRFLCLPGYPQGPQPGPEHLGTVHLCPDVETLERAWQEASAGYPSAEPMIEIYMQTATDDSLAPPGSHILSLFVQYFPYNLAPGLDLDQERERFADRVIAIIARYAPNVPQSIQRRQILTPRDLESRFGLTGGHIFHGDLLPPTLWNSRPASGSGFVGAHTPIAGLYLCGSGAHPGGCVCGAPGYNAALTALTQASSS